MQYDQLQAGNPDITPFNRIMFARHIRQRHSDNTRTGGDVTFLPDGAPAGGTAIFSTGDANVTLTGTIVAINEWLAGNHLTSIS